MAWRRGRKITPKKWFTYLMATAVVCLLLPGQLTNKLDHFFWFLMSPLSQGSRNLTLSVTGRLQEQAREPVTAEQHQALQEQYQRAVNFLANTEQELRYQKDWVERLSGLPEPFSLERMELITAQVTGSDTSSSRQIKQLDRGSLHQVKIGQVALGAIGSRDVDSQTEDFINQVYQMAVIGRVSDVGVSTSRMQLINDPKFTVPVVVVPGYERRENWRARGIMLGKEMGIIEITMIDTTYPVEVGDTVLVAGGNHNFTADRSPLPVDMVVGFVKSCRRGKNPVMWRIAVKSAVDLTKLNKVIIVGR